MEQDNRRHNDLATAGWTPLRFNTNQIQEELTEYCLPKIDENIKRLGGSFEGNASRGDDSNVSLDWHPLVMFGSALGSANQTKTQKEIETLKIVVNASMGKRLTSA